MTTEKRQFQAEVSRLLHIVTHSLYSEKQIFLRELISNASDACDKLRYLSLTDNSLLGKDSEFKIKLKTDEKKQTLTISDNGCGMDKEELITHLGTIAKSGTAAFVEKVSAASLIGQFGVGFYSAFIVADKVEVVSKTATSEEAWKWSSDGAGEFEIEPSEKKERGTEITLHLKEDSKEFLERVRLEHIVKMYSDHISIPILWVEGKKEEQLNRGSALWTRPKAEITPELYKEFYHHTAHAFDEPWHIIHNVVEGIIQYTNLLFIPSQKPFDMFTPERETKIKLYVKRVFISEQCQELLPAYLRFVRGIVDCDDLPLNVSREMLQNNPVLAKIKSGLTKKILSELEFKANSDKESYLKFWEQFGAVLKEGIYEDVLQKEAILKLARFYSYAQDKLISLEDYIASMKAGQKEIYVLFGEERTQLLKSPQLEGFKAKGVDVLILTDPIDDFWLPMADTFQEHPLKSITKGKIDLDEIATETKEEKAEEKAEKAAHEAEIGKLIASFKLTLKEQVKDVVLSKRLTDSPVCLVADENDMDIHLERLLKQHQKFEGQAKRILEINPHHPMVLSFAEDIKQGTNIEDIAFLLLDQARILEGEPLPDPTAFAKRLTGVLQKNMAA